jgi:hypothetical protein
MPREFIQGVPQWTDLDRKASASDAIAKPIAELGEFLNTAVQFQISKPSRACASPQASACDHREAVQGLSE